MNSDYELGFELFPLSLRHRKRMRGPLDIHGSVDDFAVIVYEDECYKQNIEREEEIMRKKQLTSCITTFGSRGFYEEGFELKLRSHLVRCKFL